MADRGNLNLPNSVDCCESFFHESRLAHRPRMVWGCIAQNTKISLPFECGVFFEVFVEMFKLRLFPFLGYGPSASPIQAVRFLIRQNVHLMVNGRALLRRVLTGSAMQSTNRPAVSHQAIVDLQ